MKFPPSIENWIDELDREKMIEFKEITEDEQFRGYLPYDVKIKLTFRCNAECYYCLHGIRTLTQPSFYSKNELSTFEWKKILEELAELGTKVLTFSGGEPTLRSDLDVLVSYACELGMRVKMTTNGSFMTEQLAEKLALAGLRSVNISLDGIGGDHDRVRGKGMFDRTWNGILNLDRMFRRYGTPKLRLNHVLTSDNYDKLFDFLTYIDNSSVNIQAVNLLFINTGHNSETLGLDHPKVSGILDQFLHLKDKVTLDIRESNLLLNLETANSDFVSGNYTPQMLAMPCYFPYIHMFVMHNGDVVVCCGAERDESQILGNLKNNSAMDVWNGSEYRRIREYLKNDKFKFCLNCDHGININTKLHQMVKDLEVISE